MIKKRCRNSSHSFMKKIEVAIFSLFFESTPRISWFKHLYKIIVQLFISSPSHDPLNLKFPYYQHFLKNSPYDNFFSCEWKAFQEIRFWSTTPLPLHHFFEKNNHAIISCLIIEWKKFFDDYDAEKIYEENRFQVNDPLLNIFLK